jgi:hypothetical protein
MERELQVDRCRIMHAARSLAYNRELKPVIEGRIERAESKIRGYLLGHGLDADKVGAFEVAIDDNGDISYARLSIDEWEQLELPQTTEIKELDSGGQESVIVFTIGKNIRPIGE